jgi:hypothetical protein
MWKLRLTEGRTTSRKGIHKWDFRCSVKLHWTLVLYSIITINYALVTRQNNRYFYLSFRHLRRLLLPGGVAIAVAVGGKDEPLLRWQGDQLSVAGAGARHLPGVYVQVRTRGHRTVKRALHVIVCLSVLNVVHRIQREMHGTL